MKREKYINDKQYISTSGNLTFHILLTTPPTPRQRTMGSPYFVCCT